MGKGDKKTRRGKLFQGSFGVRRPKSKPVTAPVAVKVKTDKEVKEVKEVKEAKAPVPEVKAPKTAPAKKEAKPKKPEEAAS
jgi:30S ribosomal protein S31